MSTPLKVPSVFVAAMLLGATLFYACGTTPPCGPDSCFGCCDAAGTCVAPSNAACGVNGGMCSPCAASQSCVAGLCEGGTSKPETKPDSGTTTPTDGGTVSCRAGLTSCNGRCVDMTADNLNCGECGRFCIIGAGEICSDSSCIEAGSCTGPSDCPTGSWCDGSQCKAGCDTTSDCPTGGTCTASTKTCSCPGGTQACGDACVASDDITACGPSCQQCETDPNGSTTCTSGKCAMSCNTGFHKCGSSCADNNSVNSCGGSCTPCTAPANGVATCDGTSCGYYCNPGYRICASGCCPFTVELVSNELNETVAMALDGQHRPHIAFGYNSELRYATKQSSGSFAVQDVWTGINGRNVAITVASDGAPHMAFTAGGNSGAALFHATPVGGAMTAVDAGYTYDTFSPEGSNIGIVADSAGQPLIVEAATFYLKEHFKTAEGWRGQNGLEDVFASSPLTAVRDSAGTVHAAFVGEGSAITYSRKPAGGVWAIQEEVSGRGLHLDGPALAVHGNVPHLVWYQWSANMLKHAVRGANGWTVTDLARVPAEHLALAIDSGGSLHILLQEPSEDGLYYLKKSGTKLELSALNQRASGNQLSIAVDASGNPRFAWVDWLGDLLYAY